MKMTIRKKFENVIFFEEINLSRSAYGEDIKEINLAFDKKLLEYRKHFLCFTKNEFIIIGYLPILKTGEAPKMYKKSYKLENLDHIQIISKKHEYNATEYETKISYRTVTSPSGNTYDEKVEEHVPYTVKRTMDILLGGYIYFKNTVVEKMCFGFATQKMEEQDKTIIKINKISKKLNIPCENVWAN